MSKKNLMIIMVALVAMFLMIIPVAGISSGTLVNQGATVFIGEEGLDITLAMNGTTTLGYWSDGANFDTSPYSISVTGRNGSFSVTPVEFSGREGNWYQINGSVRENLAFRVEEPRVSIDIINSDWESINGRTIVAGTNLTFKINTNIVLNDRRTGVSNGYMDIIIKTESGTTYNKLVNTNNIPVNLIGQNVPSGTFYWENWSTGNLINGQRTYQNGIYSVYVKSKLNRMDENYKVTGKTVSEIRTITLGSSTLKLTVNKDSVVRGKPFSVTITGQPNVPYMLSLKNIADSILTAPKFILYQDGVTPVASSNSRAIITTDSSGMRTVGFTTSNDTKEQKYTFHVNASDVQKYDEVSINVVKGGLTLVANGDQSYYLGEEIKLSGTNSETETTYFFIIGPNLDTYGVSLVDSDTSVITGNETTFVTADVDSDDIFTYIWATSGVDLDSGTYTIYGVSQPVNKNNLQDVSYATVSVIIKKPYVSASSPRTIAKGDSLYITGDAEGNPSSGVAIWILGKNYAERTTQSVDSDGTYEYELPGGETLTMSSGQYFVVVQHPMQNGEFDIVIDDPYVRNNVLGNNGTMLGSGMNIFKLYGSGSLQGSDAAEALIQAISDPNIDDTYTKLTILVEEPLIAIDTIGNRHVGDKFSITGKTNLAIDDEILIEVYSSSFKPTQKTQSGEFSGTTGTVKVVKSEAGMNKFSLDVDASTFKIDEYIVVAQGVAQDATGTTLFNVVEGASVPIPVVTAPVIITIPPTAPPQTVPPTIPPTEVPVTTTESPGFGAVFALIGLGAVAFMVVRRE